MSSIVRRAGLWLMLATAGGEGEDLRPASERASRHHQGVQQFVLSLPSRLGADLFAQPGSSTLRSSSSFRMQFSIPTWAARSGKASQSRCRPDSTRRVSSLCLCRQEARSLLALDSETRDQPHEEGQPAPLPREPLRRRNRGHRGHALLDLLGRLHRRSVTRSALLAQLLTSFL